MLDTLTLKNFRKHRDAEFKFGEGLVVLRGANEAGKTTIGEAILYAFFGATVLRESLDMVVSYDQPESSLKVGLTWHLDGVDYKVVRGKSGAELTYADQIVTGQRETRSFVERLLGCTADTAKMLMFADQNSVRGVLAKGGSAANGLVETLAQLGLIEDLVERVQAQLPSGNTKAVDAQIETLKAAVVTIPDEPSDSGIAAAKAEISSVLEKIDLTKASTPADQDVTKARVAVQARNAATVELARLKARAAEISATLAKSVAVPAFTLAALEQARKDAANIAEQERRWRASQTVFPQCPDEWEGTIATAESFERDTEVNIDKLTLAITKLNKSIVIAEMRKVNEKNCVFCKKDLSEVPEVEQINAAADAEVIKLKAELATAEAELQTDRATLKAVQQVLKVTTERKRLAGEYWALDDSIPPKPTWIGEPAVKPGTSNLPAMEREWSAYQTVKVQREMLEAELAGLQYPEVPDVTDAEALIAKAAAVEAELQALVIKRVQAEGKLATVTAQYNAAVASRQSAIVQNDSNQKALEQLVGTRDSMHKHNELVKKLRAARPEIAAKMWGTVLGAISRYFSQIRGEASVVTREADGFKVNGRSIDGLSGSTNDALGLAIRMALSKLFLPSVPFLFLDEAFAGADDTRELDGVATLAGAGFSQVLLVTHSPLPESIADSLIVL